MCNQNKSSDERKREKQLYFWSPGGAKEPFTLWQPFLKCCKAAKSDLILCSDLPNWELFERWRCCRLCVCRCCCLSNFEFKYERATSFYLPNETFKNRTHSVWFKSNGSKNLRLKCKLNKLYFKKDSILNRHERASLVLKPL